MQHAGRHPLTVGDRRLRQHQCELIAAEACAGVTDTHLGVDALRHLAQHGVACQMSVLVVDALEVVDVDHQAHDRLSGALRPRQLFAQARLQVAPIMETGEEIGEAAAQQARAIDGVLDADRRHQPQVRQEITRQLLGEAQRVDAGEHQHAVELLVTPQRDEREAPRTRDARQQQLVVGLVERPQPRALEVGELRRHRRQRVDEAHSPELLEPQAVPGEQMPDFVLRVVQDQLDVIELVRGPQAHDEPLEQLRQRAGAQQFQLALLCLAQQRVVAADLLGERGETGAQAANFVLELATVGSRWRVTGQRLGVRSTHGARILLILRCGAPPGCAGPRDNRARGASKQRMRRGLATTPRSAGVPPPWTGPPGTPRRSR